MVKAFLRNNKFELSAVIILLSFVFISQYRFNQEMKENGVEVEGEIIRCEKLYRSGECAVTVRYIDKRGIGREFNTKLYDKENCMMGKIVKVMYSNQTDHVEVLEHVELW